MTAVAEARTGGGRVEPRPADQPILAVEQLQTYFHTRDGIVRAVDGVSFRLGRGETLSIVGESGCGKSVTAMSILRLLPEPPAKIEARGVLFEGENLLDFSMQEMRGVRGNEISMIFQEPMTSLNPVLTVGRQISESLILHQGMSRREALERSIDMLDLVRIPDPRRRVHEYPHQMSGGMRQRVMIAMALSCNPKVLIADEPTTALDVTIQAQILALMSELKDRLGTAIIIITHDLGVVSEMAERVVVMYAGRKVEEAEVKALFAEPLHPYTLGLMGSIPRLNEAAMRDGKRPRLQEIPGTVPALIAPIPGCAFAPRCTFAGERCHLEAPPLEEKRPGHFAACWETQKVEARRHG
jgi:peptide/nickel transport system ATP-binding protein